MGLKCMQGVVIWGGWGIRPSTFDGDARRGGIGLCGLLGFGVGDPPEDPGAIQSSLPHSCSEVSMHACQPSG